MMKTRIIHLLICINEGYYVKFDYVFLGGHSGNMLAGSSLHHNTGMIIILCCLSMCQASLEIPLYPYFQNKVGLNLSLTLAEAITYIRICMKTLNCNLSFN